MDPRLEDALSLFNDYEEFPKRENETAKERWKNADACMRDYRKEQINQAEIAAGWDPYP